MSWYTYIICKNIIIINIINTCDSLRVFFCPFMFPLTHTSLPLPLLQETTGLFYVTINQFGFFFLEFQINENKSNIRFLSALLTHVVLMSIYVVFMNSTFFSLLHNSPMLELHNILFYFLMGCFQALTVRNQAAIEDSCAILYMDIDIHFS